jgi:acetamidase/formamidase
MTGPIEVRGAQSADVLEVRILDISLAVDYGYNRQKRPCGSQYTRPSTSSSSASRI